MDWVALIPLLPAAAFIALLPLSRAVRNRMLWLPVAAMSGSLALSVASLIAIWPSGSAEAASGPAWRLSWPLASVGGADIGLSLSLDPLAAATLTVVTIVATGVLVYSLGYLHRDDRRGWYFAVVSLFTSAMLALVLSGNLLLTFAMWEVMGLCSYLLIGFWHELEAPRKASQKAFLTTRIGDLGFLVALFAIFANTGSFDLAQVLQAAPGWAPGVALVVALGLLWAAMGKSAQLPLHVWLPDAMAGPTPASALIHAATMVAAGVFVVARMLPVFELVPGVMSAMLVIGAVTALVGGLLAAVQHDVKKVAAYSTISQLGLMFVALGAGSATAALFHLTTHAFFKSLIFLGSGVIIHSAHTQDMREMGGLAKHLPVTTVTFGIGCLALAGVPPLSGFFSKDEILAVLLHDQHYAIFAVVVLSSAITAYYVTRLWFRVFTGPEQGHGLHEAHYSMLAPMVVLAAITLVAGFGTTLFAGLFGETGHFPGLDMWLISFAVAGTGIAAGWWIYGRRSAVTNTRVWKDRFGYAYDALANKLYFDLTYEKVFIRGYFVLASELSRFDARVVDGVVNGAARVWSVLSGGMSLFDGRVVDGAVNGLASGARALGNSARRIQTGRLQDYQRLIVGASLCLLMGLYVLMLVKGAG